MPKLLHYGETRWEVEELIPNRKEGGGFRFINLEGAKFTHCAEVDVERKPSTRPGFEVVHRFTKDFKCWYEDFHDDSEEQREREVPRF